MQPQDTTTQVLSKIYEQLNELSVNGVGLKSDVAQLKKDMGELIEGQKYTNGKVAALQEDKIRREERESVLASLPKNNQTIVKAENATIQKIDQDALNKFLLGIGAIAAAIATVIMTLLGVMK